MNEKKFAHLHLHTEYSLLDGATRIKKIFPRMLELGQTAVAITDHGNMYGAMSFYQDYKEFKKKSEAKGIDVNFKLIFGCEVYTVPDRFENKPREKRNHLILLCKNETGYHNLIKLVSLGFTEGFYYKPRVDFSVLKKYHEGLICLSACIAGELPQAILSGDFEEAYAVVKKFKNLFGDDYYVEIQDHGLKSQRFVLPYLIDIANKNGVGIVATNDVHYLKKEDAVTQKILQCISFGTTLNPDDAFADSSLAEDDSIDDDSYFPTNEFYMKSRSEMLEVFPNFEDALDNTMAIADKCEDIGSSIFRKKELYPLYKTPDGSSSMDYLRRLTYEGLKDKFSEITDELKNRADYELSIIEIKNFPDYFLVVWDYINYAESIGISVGPGRGSGAGSLVAYAIGITKLNPLKYDLYFERFLNPERVSNPDFDIDFCVERREEVIEYVRKKYGDECVSQIATFGTMAAKQAVKDVGRVLDVPFSRMNELTKIMPKMMGKMTLENILGFKPYRVDDVETDATVPEFRDAYYTNDEYKRIIDYAIQIEGMPRQTGLHAAGVIICRDPISMHAPLACNTDKKVASQYNMTQIEALGMLKMDFLGLRNLTDIKKTLDLVEKRTGKRIDLYAMDYSDPEVFRMISSGDTHAVFQLENGGMTNFMKTLQPDCLEDLIAGISLYRPGPMDEIPTFIYNKKHPEEIKYIHPVLEKNLSMTYNVMVYQEQVMNICKELAGYTMGGADSIRRMMSKKKVDKLLAEEKNFIYGGTFVDGDNRAEVHGAIASGMSEADARELFDKMKSFARYAFNKSHAAAYAFITYQTAYLKHYYVREFIVAVLNNRITNIGKITENLDYLRQRGIRILPPDVNHSEAGFSVEGDGVRIGMAAIKGVGTGVIEQIVAEREKNGEFKNLPDFLDRLGDVNLNSRLIENLIYAGAFDCFGQNRSVLLQVFPALRERYAISAKEKNSNQMSMFDDVFEGFEMSYDVDYPDIPELSEKDRLRMEKEVSGIYLTGHPLKKYETKLASFEINSSDIEKLVKTGDEEGEMPDMGNDVVEEEGLSDKSPVTLGGMIVSAEKKLTKSGNYIGIGTLEDLSGTVDLMISSGKLNSLFGLFKVDNLVTVKGTLSIRDERSTPTVWVDSITLWNESADTPAQESLRLYLKLDGGIDNPLYDEIGEIFDSYPGKDTIYIQNNGVLQMLTDVKTDAKAVQPLIMAVLGPGNVKVAQNQVKKN